MQKNASFKSKHEKQVASAGIRASSVLFGNRKHIDFSLGALIPGDILVGSFLGAPLCLFFSFYPDWNCVLPVHLMLLPGNLLSFSSFILFPFELSCLS
jgi:hypothetical protein